jgi:hypothetical protein
MRLVHRVVWEAVNGHIPEDMTVDHMRTVCMGPPCVRPDHLRLLSNFDNAQRNNGQDWPSGQCVKGHPHSERIRRGGQTVCGACVREYYREYMTHPESKAKAVARQQKYYWSKGKARRAAKAAG